MSGRLAGKAAIVTGGASGFGEGIVRKAAATVVGWNEADSELLLGHLRGSGKSILVEPQALPQAFQRLGDRRLQAVGDVVAVGEAVAARLRRGDRPRSEAGRSRDRHRPRARCPLYRRPGQPPPRRSGAGSSWRSPLPSTPRDWRRGSRSSGRWAGTEPRAGRLRARWPRAADCQREHAPRCPSRPSASTGCLPPSAGSPSATSSRTATAVTCGRWSPPCSGSARSRAARGRP